MISYSKTLPIKYFISIMFQSAIHLNILTCVCTDLCMHCRGLPLKAKYKNENVRENFS